MTFQDGGSFDSNRVKKRSGGKIAAGGGIGVIAIALLSQFIDLGPLTPLIQQLLGGGSSTPSTETGLEGCETAEDANTKDECRYGWTLESLDTYWATALPQQTGIKYTAPGAVSFENQVSTACGSATSASGPFYCPGDQTVYIDVAFYDVLRSQFGTSAGPLAQQYIIAHEVGHHIENLTGLLAKAQRQGTGPESDSVRTELMADCLAGMWAGAAATTINPETGKPDLEPITEAQLRDALDAAAAVGDDRIQQAQTGQVNPHAFTHGSAAQRQKWFMNGYQNQDINKCNAFASKDLG
ncbi:neutral zinc metallopeptidase [Timonella senegalensis]|uniref:KPN_02809 family neutral zinc metallopeptidase n=1 Tax=Timonella senegalensis TaxID=1465825 RepID=UPI002FDE1E7E